MSAVRPCDTPSMAALAVAVDAAIRTVAPAWPLDRQIAVNPYWGFADRSFERAAATMGRLVGARFTLPPDDYLRAWRSGEITAAAVNRAIAQGGSSATLDQAISALRAPQVPNTGLPLLSDLIDEHAQASAGPRWRDTVTQQVSQYCASYFDEHQADWRRGRAGGLFSGWRNGLEADHALEPLMRAPEIRARARNLPTNADDAIGWALRRLDISGEHATPFLQVCLLRINGWASWCAYLQWEARLVGGSDSHLRELLAIRASWEALLHEDEPNVDSPATVWKDRWAESLGEAASPFDALHLIWQRAHEISYQDRLIDALQSGPDHPRSTHGEVARSAQLVFCIDVRSERLRRALEEVDPTLETRGFAGFFGLPIRYTPIGTSAPRPQLPGLVAPQIDATDSTGDPRADAMIANRRSNRLAAAASRLAFQRLPTGAFSFVEMLGIGYAGAMLKRHFGLSPSPLDHAGLEAVESTRLRPRLCAPDGADGATGGRHADLLASILGAMGLTAGFARLLVFVGHGSQSANNPQAAALECGACGGQSGEVNARILAGLLNEPSVRLALGKRGIDIPAETIAIAALHNTCTDEVRLFDVEHLPVSHEHDLERLRRNLREAGHRTRAERAPSLGIAALADRPEALLKRYRRRARDWAETRPEWGLANNAAFIVAPRSRTRGVNLAGRSFLHDYCWEEDRDGRVLELIMTAPMVVTHWINLQYYASTVDPDRFGSGNKVLHNVVCGRIGVFEGNTGDLRVGLSRQSVHDGERWMHAPLRLSVFIDAPRDRIERVIAGHPTVRSLVDHRWLHLFRFADAGVEHHDAGAWRDCG